MPFTALDENTALFPVERLKYGSRTLVAFYNAMKRKIGILHTAYDNERSVRYQRGEVPHFKVSADAGDIVAAAMVKRNDGILKFAD
jgi:hypothetical protein